VTQRRHHYELAFEVFLRARRIPYVAVDEARKALLPDNAALRVVDADQQPPRAASLKSFDFVIYGPIHSGSAPSLGAENLLVEVKGRKIGLRRPRPTKDIDAMIFTDEAPSTGGDGAGRLESWVTQEDVESLRTWERLFGTGFAATFVFLYWCEQQPPDALFQEIFEHRGRWYAVRAVTLADYAREMKVRSPRWGTVHVPPTVFERISRPFTGR
jgi:hypothetical protein